MMTMVMMMTMMRVISKYALPSNMFSLALIYQIVEFPRFQSLINEIILFSICDTNFQWSKNQFTWTLGHP